jgi:hypothetical protein
MRIGGWGLLSRGGRGILLGRTRLGRTRLGRTRLGRTRLGRTRLGGTRLGGIPLGGTYGNSAIRRDFGSLLLRRRYQILRQQIKGVSK